MARKARWLAATAVGAVAAGASLWMLTPASATGAVNPVEGGLGFLVLVERDATLTGTESEGPLAVGRDLTFGSSYRIAAERSVRVGAGETPLVIGGRALLGAPPVVDAKVLGMDDPAAKDDSPGVLLRGTDPATPVPGARKASLADQDALDLPGVFATFRERSQQLDSCAETVKLRNSGGGVLSRPVSTPGTRAYVSLTPNQTNVLKLTGDEFNNLSDLTFNTQPSAETPLLVNVDTGTDYEWRTANFAGIGDEQAPYILMNFADATTITQVGADTAEGTIYAPNAAFTDVNTANNEGNLVVRDYTHGTAAANGGETHDLPFNTTLQCGGATSRSLTAPLATTEPATTEPATTEPATAGPAVAAPIRSATGAPAQTGAPTPTASVVPGVAAPTVEPPTVGEIPTDPAPMDSKLPWAWPTEPQYLPPVEPSTFASEPSAPGAEAPVLPGEAPVLPGEAPAVPDGSPVLPGDDSPAAGDSAAGGDPAGDVGPVDPGTGDELPFFPSGTPASPAATPSGATVAPSGSTEPAVIANYGPLPGQGGAESGESLTRPSTVRLVIAGLAILVVSTALLLLGRRRKIRHRRHAH